MVTSAVRRGVGRRWLVTLLLTIGLVASARVQFHTFPELLERYRRGEPGAAEEFARWDREKVVRDAVLDPSVSDSLIIAAAVGLHTEAGLRRGDFMEYVGLGLWGAPKHSDFEPHYWRASELVEGLARRQDLPDAIQDFLRDWYVVASSFGLRADRTRRDIEFGLARFPDDLALGLQWAFTVEWWLRPATGDDAFAGFYPQDWNKEATAIHQPAGTSRLVSTTHGEFNPGAAREAEVRLKRLSAAHPTAGEVRLRMGRVYFLIDRVRDARAEYEAALVLGASNQDRFTTYLAALFLGQLEELAGNLPVAAVRYRQAADMLPEARAARIALGRLMILQGQADRGWAIIGETIESAATPDPWDQYMYGQYRRLNEMLAGMRRSLRP